MEEDSQDWLSHQGKEELANRIGGKAEEVFGWKDVTPTPGVFGQRVRNSLKRIEIWFCAVQKSAE